MRGSVLADGVGAAEVVSVVMVEPSVRLAPGYWELSCR
ncbi:hypothetical protein F4561_005285 [Lipingzhangella halophila]|uniref:Uncharacterized protein n=1 Tax=Lipingzhangella halophila TaxID=1783352 RepID=A0A7W7RM10_9ACTN|nr:hypothetical protein [Lipingzhangella halophila]